MPKKFQLNFIDPPKIEEKITTEQYRLEIKPSELIALADTKKREVLAERINFEFNAFDKLSEPFSDVIKKTGIIFKGYGEFLVNNLRETDAPSQLLAIMALVAKSDGIFYAPSTNFTKAM